MNSSAMELVNEVPEEEVGPYDTPYLAEFYDLFWGKSEDVDADVPVYWDAIQEQLKTTECDQLVVLDLATGTGRIIKGLANRSPQAPSENLLRVDFVGLDLSEDMLDTAKKSDIAVEKLGGLTWVLGDILDLESALPKGCKIDLMMLGLGTIGHLHKVGQFEKLLEEAKKFLKPETGRFYVTILEVAQDLLSDETTETQLLSDPNCFVRETTRSSAVVDKTFKSNSHMLVLHRDMVNRRDVVIANYSVDMNILLWDADLIRDVVVKAGMKVVDEFRNGQQTYVSIAI